MATMDIFNHNAFSTASLTGTVQRREYVPQMLGSLGLFGATPSRSRVVFVERTAEGLSLIPTSADGAPPETLEGDDRDLVPLRTSRLAKRFTLYAHELDGIRAFGSETELMQVQREYMRRTDRIRRDMELTHEHMRLGALQGVVLDADGSTILYDYRDIFQEAIPAPTNFAFSDPDFDILKTEKDIKRSMVRSSKGNLAGSTIHVLAGDTFYDELVSHPSYEKFYLNQSAARSLAQEQGKVFESFRSPSGITYHNYQGTDDNSTVAVPEEEAKFFPVGAQDVFSAAYAPLESMEYVNTPGQEIYLMNVVDRDRGFWTKGEIYSYPLFVCQQPSVLRRATMS